MKSQFRGVEIECVMGDIASQNDVQAVVADATTALREGGSIIGGFHKLHGPDPDGKGRETVRPGSAVMTRGPDQANTYVIHCPGPVYGVDEPVDALLASCYRNALQLGEEYGVESIAFPAISAGESGYPLMDAAQVAFATILETIPRLTRIKRIRLVFVSVESASIAASILNQQIRLQR